MKVFRPAFLEDNLTIIQVSTDSKFDTHIFKDLYVAFKFYSSFKENEIAYKHYAVTGI